MPALLTSTSSLPKCLVVAATTAAQLSSLVTSSGSNRAEAPMASATCLPSCSSTSPITTLAPSRANMRAVAAPMPDAAPEMMATLPVSLIAVLPCALNGAQRPAQTSAVHDQPAIDAEGLASHVVRARRHEEPDHVGDVLRSLHAPQGDLVKAP